jgi:hypothetical protein
MQIESKFFNTHKTDLFGNVRKETVIGRDNFIYEAGRQLLELINDDNFQDAIHDYSRTLCAIVKYEMLEEMKKRIDNIDAFYHI